MFNCTIPSIVFQEVPNQVSLCFCITGCQIGCKGCHSPELWQETHGHPLTNQIFTDLLTQYQGLITCVLFLGGEWAPLPLIEKLVIAREHGLLTCLYSGEAVVALPIIQHLNFLKTGSWQQEKGGLDNPKTNQKFIDVHTGKNLTHLFCSGELHAST